MRKKAHNLEPCFNQIIDDVKRAQAAFPNLALSMSRKAFNQHMEQIEKKPLKALITEKLPNSISAIVIDYMGQNTYPTLAF